MLYKVPKAILAETFGHLRRCGDGRRECQALWVGAWRSPTAITKVVHPRHRANAVGFQLDHEWINEFWDELGATECGIRVQVHTHPGAAFHSATDDAYPISFRTGFLSLVIPNFALGPVGFDGAFLAELAPDGKWQEVPIRSHLEIL
jgi:hypothetical protein